MKKLIHIILFFVWVLILPSILTHYYTTKRGVSKEQLEEGISYAYESIVAKPLQHGIKQLHNDDTMRIRRDTFSRIEPKIFKIK